MKEVCGCIGIISNNILKQRALRQAAFHVEKQRRPTLGKYMLVMSFGKHPNLFGTHLGTFWSYFNPRAKVCWSSWCPKSFWCNFQSVFLYIYIYIYMHAYTHICPHLAYMHASTHICTHIRIYARIYAYMRASTHICTHIRIYASIRRACMHACTQI